ncbi:HSP20 family protein [Salirhabdus euzebyi]|uniref:HSP20 family protein n=1 Tax=Salirhabdus euzebyi TaxID=394506 RepID=A0A841PY82_9BACI|nr:Hsp20/alpha crystallin family protein [Salirhabdus euzebyi]MBB6451841.1 HSP20 family protein [Salirhabdus euzebyi]
MNDMLDPLRELSKIKHNLNNMLSNLTNQLQMDSVPFRHTIKETENEIIVKCNIPGIRREKDVIIDIEEDTLTVRATIQQAMEINQNNMYRKESYFQHFHKSIPLPHKVVDDHAEATYEHGILTVHIPKRKVIDQ